MDTFYQLVCIVMGALLVCSGYTNIKEPWKVFDKALGWFASIGGGVTVLLGLAGLVGLIN
jgi:hypothetical protein